MGFVNDILGDKSGVVIYYIIGLLIFISLFALIVYRTVRMTKQELQSYKESILDENTES